MLEASIRLDSELSKVVKKYPALFEYALTESISLWQLTLNAEFTKNLEGRNLKRRTGNLAQSLSWVAVKRAGRNFELILRSTMPYARIQETGGTVTPVNVDWLTVPLPAAKKPSGALKKPAREWPNTFVQKSRKGNLIIFQNAGRGEIIPLFVLKKKVKIPPSHWFSDAVERSRDELLLILKEEVDYRLVNQ